MKGQLEVLTVREAAAELRITPQTLRGLIRRGALHAGRLGRRWRLSRAELVRFLEGEPTK